MRSRTRSLPAACLLGISLSLTALAEEHAESKPAKAAAAHDAPKSESAASTKPAAAKETSAAKPTKAEPAASAKTVAMAAPPAHRAPERPPVVANSNPPPPRVAEAIATATTEKTAAPHHAPHWSYEGPTGPHAWARLSPEFAKCATGTRQSPIDIREGMKVDLDPISFDYRPSAFRVIDNGHTVQVNISGWNTMRIMGRRFKLVQFHFHSPSEEMVEGKQYDMVAHLVHKDSEDRLAVIAVLIENGSRQPAIQTVLNNLPLEKNEEMAASSPIDLNQLLPKSQKYFTYMGSLTTPPCSEDVLWIVMKQPVQATTDQLNLFARLYPMNARPVQDARDRLIKESN